MHEWVVERIEVAVRRSVGPDYAWPGSVRELEQAVRRILLTGHYFGSVTPQWAGRREQLLAGLEAGSLDADGVLAGYCALLYDQFGTYEEVARRTHLDWRTVKKYVQCSA
ncbi:MAG TPA: hypothetical protein VNZ22_06910 [Bacillota bacterium]|nr:hypothetical protein [Bacillota bacterium]